MGDGAIRRRCGRACGIALAIIVATTVAGVFLARHPAPGWDHVPFAWFRMDRNSAVLAGPAWLGAFWRVISFLGNTGPRVLEALLALGGLWLLRRWRSACWLAWILVSGIALSSVLKVLVDRARPEVVAHLVAVHSPSFPSGHALNATLFYVGAALLFALVLRRRWWRGLVIGLAAVLSLATGIARVALGVHYPSDVLAGWLIGGAWLALWWAVAWCYWPATFSTSGVASSRA